MLTDFLRYAIGEPDKYEINRPYYVLKGDGVYLYKSTGALLMKKLFTGFGEKRVPGLVKGEEGVEYQLPKVPFRYWLMILDFYKEVYEKNGTEASVHIFHKKDGKDIPDNYLTDETYSKGVLVEGDWVVYCPKQRNTATITEFGDDEFYQWLRVNLIPVIETHSHHKMDAFWSQTDNDNQQDEQYYGVYGRIGTKDKFLMKHVVGGEYTNIPVTDVFEFPTVETVQVVTQIEGYEIQGVEDKTEVVPYEGVFKSRNEYPEEWFEMIQGNRK